MCAFQGDQLFHGSLTEAKGLGRYLGIVGSPTVTSESLGAAIIDMMENRKVQERAARTSALVRAEDGVTVAADFIDSLVESHTYPWPTARSGTST